LPDGIPLISAVALVDLETSMLPVLEKPFGPVIV
jgi:hypothetical protein